MLGEYLKELDKLDLPKSQYAIFGSGPLAIRGLRDSDDLDIIVKTKLWNYLKSKYKQDKVQIKGKNYLIIKIGKVEVGNSWGPYFGNMIDKLIGQAEIIDGYPFIKLEYVLEWKKKSGREKDKVDIRLINDFLKNETKQAKNY